MNRPFRVGYRATVAAGTVRLSPQAHEPGEELVTPVAGGRPGAGRAPEAWPVAPGWARRSAGRGPLGPWETRSPRAATPLARRAWPAGRARTRCRRVAG